MNQEFTLPVVLQSQARSRSSGLMRMLELGGVPCEYKGSIKLDPQQWRNIHGFFEVSGEPTYTKCFKSLGVERLKKIPKTVKVIYLVRDFEQMIKSQKAVHGEQWKGRDTAVKLRNDIEKELLGRPVLRIKSEDLAENPRNECERIKDFLAGTIDFDVDAAVSGFDNSLTKIR